MADRESSPQSPDAVGLFLRKLFSADMYKYSWESHEDFKSINVKKNKMLDCEQSLF